MESPKGRKEFFIRRTDAVWKDAMRKPEGQGPYSEFNRTKVTDRNHAPQETGLALLVEARERT